MRAAFLKRLLVAVVLLAVLPGCGLLSGLSLFVPRPGANESVQAPTPEVVLREEVDNPQAQPPAAPDTIAPSIALEQAYISLYERVNPSVVNIRVVEGGSSRVTGEDVPDLPDIPGLPDLPEGSQVIPSQAEGSGFIYSEDGYIVTNNHVVAGATKIVVTFSDGSEAAAEMVGADPSSDLAVIRVDVDPSMLIPVALGDSDELKVGQFVVAIGNPFGEKNSMTTGIVSGLGRMLPTNAAAPSGGQFNIPDMIQTDTAINPGNSGGPLLNLSGEVVGVNTAIATQIGTNSGVGYAIPASIVRQVVPQLIEGQGVEYPWLGISGGTLSADMAREMDLDPSQRGVLISEVIENSPAEKAGLRGSTEEATIDGLQATIGGDVITAIDGQPVRVFDDLLGYIVRQTRVGDTVTLDILRDGEPMQVEVTMEARPGGD